MPHRVRSAIVLVLALLVAWPTGLAAAQEAPKPKTAAPAKAPAKTPAKTPAKAPAKGLAQVRGVLLDSQGLPAKGYQVALKDKAGNLFMSAPSGVDGAFVVASVPPTAYRLTAFAPDGTEFPVLSKEVALQAGQVERVEIRISGQGAAPGRTPQPKTAKASSSEKKRAAAAPTTEKGGIPTGALIGIVVAGAFAIGALASTGGGDGGMQPPVSPTFP